MARAKPGFAWQASGKRQVVRDFSRIQPSSRNARRRQRQARPRKIVLMPISSPPHRPDQGRGHRQADPRGHAPPRRGARASPRAPASRTRAGGAGGGRLGELIEATLVEARWGRPRSAPMTHRFGPSPSKRIWPARGSCEGDAVDGRVLGRLKTPFDSPRLRAADCRTAPSVCCRHHDGKPRREL